MLLNQKIKQANRLAIFSYCILLTLMVATSLLATLPPEASRGFLLAVKTLPWLIFLPGIFKGALRTHMWLCFVILFYFTRAVVDAFIDGGAAIDIIITALTVVLFITSMMYVRWQKQAGVTV